MNELWEAFFRGSNTPPSWENIGNTEGLPIVEKQGMNGYHRAFVELPGARRAWLFVKKTPHGYEPVGEERYTGIGITEKVAAGGIRARVFRKSETAPGGEEDWITLPPLT